jgi:hypothetical protein
LAAYAATEPTAVWPIFALVLVFGVGRAFAAPATRSLPADLVPADRLPALIPRLSISWQVAFIAGPVLAGLLYAVEPWLAFTVQAALLGIGAVLLAGLPAGRGGAEVPVIEAVAEAEAVSSLEVDAEDRLAPAPGGTVSQALEGLRFIRRQPILMGTITLDLVAVLFGGAVALLPAIAEDRLGVGAVGFGWLRASIGIGAGVVTVVLAVRPLRRHVGAAMLLSVGAFGAFTVVLGLTRNYVVAFVALAALSGADAVSVYIRSTLVPLVTPDHMRGRVLAVENVFIGASNELGAFESGVAGQALGTSGAVVLGGVATVVLAAAWWVRFPALPAVDTFPGDERARENIPE